jgi:hypothetical protein
LTIATVAPAPRRQRVDRDGQRRYPGVRRSDGAARRSTNPAFARDRQGVGTAATRFSAVEHDTERRGLVEHVRGGEAPSTRARRPTS